MESLTKKDADKSFERCKLVTKQKYVSVITLINLIKISLRCKGHFTPSLMISRRDYTFCEKFAS